MNLHRVVFLVSLIALLLSACKGEEEKAEPQTIKLAVNNWVASELNVAIAKILLEEELNFRVEVVTIDEYEQWEAIAQGRVHASLEVWPSGHQEDYQKYIETEQRVEYGGLLGPIGKISWYVPTYLITDNPERGTWEWLQDAQNTVLFSSNDSSLGQFLAGDPTWTQHDAEIIRNLGLSLEVQQLGSEDALIGALEEAYTQQKPILFYFWTPHWIHYLYQLTPVALPPYSAACYAKRDAGGIDCDYPADELYKIFWPDLKTWAPQAHALLQNISYTNNDQISMLAVVQLENKTVDEAARLWVDQNESVWKNWIP